MQAGFRQKVCVFFLLIVALIIAPRVGYTQESYQKLRVSSQLFTPHFLSEKQLQFAAEKFDAITIGHWKESWAKAAVLKHYNPNVLLFGYINSTHLIPDSWRYEECESDEDLFAHDINGNRIIDIVFGNVLMNIHNPEWTEKLIKWANELPVEMDGILLDSAGPTLHEPFYNALPAQYDPINNALAMAGLLHSVKASTSLAVCFNGLKEGLQEEGYVDPLDGGALEGFVYSRSFQDTNFNRVYAHASALIEATKRNKFFSVEVKSYRDDTQRRLFALSTYLLASSEYSSYTFIDIDNEFTQYLQYYPEYELKLGNPLNQPQSVEDLYDSKLELYVRKFENGMVILNPWQHKIKTRVPSAHYRAVIKGGGPVGKDGIVSGSLSYKAVSRSISLEPLSAVILVKKR
jgi:hypothetical protein